MTQCTLARRPQSVGLARDFVREALLYYGHTDRIDDARLCVSEAATNALLHGVPPGRSFAVGVAVSRDHVRVEVRDSGDGLPVQQPVREDTETGRGLHLIDALADSWGVEQHVVGKTVWFTLAAAPAPEDVPRLRGVGVGRRVG